MGGKNIEMGFFSEKGGEPILSIDENCSGL